MKPDTVVLRTPQLLDKLQWRRWIGRKSERETVCACVCDHYVGSHTAPRAGRLLVCHILDLGSIARHNSCLCYNRLLLVNVRKPFFCSFGL